MTVMRSVFYVPGNNEKIYQKAPTTPADIITLDLEDSVPPAEKPKAREMVRENLKLAGSGGSTIYVRINNWETLMTNDDLEAIVYEGLSGVCLAKSGGPDHVQRLDWKLEELERRRGLKVGSIAIQLLIETAKGVDQCLSLGHRQQASQLPYLGAVDYTKDMRVKLTSEGEEQFYARAHTAVAARAAGCIAIDCPFVAFKDTEAFEKSTRFGPADGLRRKDADPPEPDRTLQQDLYAVARGCGMGKGRGQGLRGRGDCQRRCGRFLQGENGGYSGL